MIVNGQWYSSIFRVCYAQFKNVVLLHKITKDCEDSSVTVFFIFVSGNLKSEELFDGVAIEWTSWRDMPCECVCGKIFEASTAVNRGTHCRRCGKIFCERCIHRTILPNTDSQTTPICSACYNLLF